MYIDNPASLGRQFDLIIGNTNMLQKNQTSELHKCNYTITDVIHYWAKKPLFNKTTNVILEDDGRGWVGDGRGVVNHKLLAPGGRCFKQKNNEIYPKIIIRGSLVCRHL